MTIASKQTAVEGILTESQLKSVKTGMRVNVSSDLFTEQITGVISKRDELPIKAPAIDVASKYRFTLSSMITKRSYTLATTFIRTLLQMKRLTSQLLSQEAF
ncbi:hypothetical protein ACI2OX_19895 [Bacillus sp. N9]